MRILLDIGHPGHVHYFKNLYYKLKDEGHDILVVARDKEVTFELLRYYKIPFINRGSGGKSKIGKFLYLFKGTFTILRAGLKHKSDLLISFASPYASIASILLRRFNIVLDDTEVGRFERLFYKPLADLIITPKAFKKKLGKKHIVFNGFMELTYLTPKYFMPDMKIMNYLGNVENEKYVIIRFVSWEASHDIGQRGLTLEQKHEIVDLCSKYAKVYISSEKALPEFLEEFRLKINPYQLHDALFYASLYIGEGATTASEACILGTPAVYINTISAGTIEEEEKFGLLFSYRDYTGVLEKIDSLLNILDKMHFIAKSKEMVQNRTDLTDLLLFIINDLPKNLEYVKKNSDYESRFE
jgi:uncharacterized protein